MSQNIIDITTLQNEYKTGLIFSMIEGLKPSHVLTLLSQSRPTDFEVLLKEASIKNIAWKIEEVSQDNWQLHILKNEDLNSASVGCCGMCGGHAQETRG